MFDDEVKDVQAEGVQPSDAPATGKAKSEPSWEDRFNGMKGTAIKHQNRADKLAAELAALRQEHEEMSLSLARERDKYKTEAEKAAAEATQYGTELNKFRKRDEIGRLIRKDYQQLTDLYDDGLLVGVESLETDALTDYLKRFTEKLGKVKEIGQRDTAAGATPPPPAQQGATSGQTLGGASNAVSEALTRYGRNSKQYQDAMNSYLAAIQNGAK